MGTKTNQIADELEAKTIGKSSSSVVENKQVTKSKAISLGCTVKGTYKDNQCTKYSDLSATSAPTQYTVGIHSSQQSTSPTIKVKLTPYGGSATTITGSQTLKVTSGTMVSISITRENHTLTSWDLVYGDTTISKGTATSFTMPSANCVIYTIWQSNSGGDGGGGGGTTEYGNYKDDYYGSEYRNSSISEVVVLGEISSSAYKHNYDEFPNTNDTLPHEVSIEQNNTVEDYDSGYGLVENLTYCVSKKRSMYEAMLLASPFIQNDTQYYALKGMGIYGAIIQECNSTPYASELSTIYPGEINETFFNNLLEDIRYVVFAHPNVPVDRTCFKYRVFENPYYHFKYTCMPNESNELAIETGLGCYECYPDESMTTFLPIKDATEDMTGGALMLYWWDTAPVIIVDKGSLPDTKLPYKYLAQIRVDLNGTINSLSDIEQDTATPWFDGSALKGYDYCIKNSQNNSVGAYSNLTVEHGDIIRSENVVHLLELCRHIGIGRTISSLGLGFNGIAIEMPNYSNIVHPDFGFMYRFVLCLINKEVQSDKTGDIIGILHCDSGDYGYSSDKLKTIECMHLLEGNQYIIFSGQESAPNLLQNYDGNGYSADDGSTSDGSAIVLEERLSSFQNQPNLNYQWSLYCEIIDCTQYSSRTSTYASGDDSSSEGSSEEPVQGGADLGDQSVITGFRIDYNSDMTLSTLHIIWQHDIYSPKYE